LDNYGRLPSKLPFCYSAGMRSDSFDEVYRQTDHSARWEAVAAARAQELAALTDEQARRIILSLRLFAPAPPDPRNGMGLVEQQAVFHRIRL
jgi:hypothetical protein